MLSPNRETKTVIGRPSKERSERRHNELLDHALEIFLEKGFDKATLDMVAKSVNMTKRTIYSKYEDKEAFFKAAVIRAIERVAAFQAKALVSCECATLEETLNCVARMRMDQMTRSEGLRLLRILNSEAYRFPEIFELSSNHITTPVVEFLARRLEKHAETGEIKVDNPKLAATAFLSMVVGAPIRIIGSGNPIDESGIEERISFCIELFMNGIRKR
ncbi:MAG: TetR/AcrR family transcriptional regulator [Novosphingobium sp.]|nr:TetR/AcrR family transcriptional regulator [Novosphingobium sp.]